MLKVDEKPTILDITSSPLNSGVNTNALNQNNTLRIPESVIMERNFAQVSVSGPARERKVNVTYINAKGEIVYEHKFEAEYKKKIPKH